MLLRSVCMLPLFAMTSCGLFSDSRPGVANVDDLVTRVERVHIEAELAQERALDAAEALKSLVTYEFGEHGDAVKSFQSFLMTIDASESQAIALRKSITSMKVAAGPVFEKWTQDLESFSSQNMRDRSRARLEETRAKYDQIVAVADPAREMFDTFNLGLRDHALFLEHDFNATSVAEISADVTELVSMRGEIDARLAETLVAARGYFESRALPMTMQRTRDTAEAERESAERGTAKDVARPPAGR